MPKDFTFIGPKRFNHQLVTFMYGILRDRVGLFLDMGTGKTISAIDIASYRKDKGKVNTTLIVSPTTVLYNWEREIKRFSDKSVEVLYGPLQDRLYKLEETNPDFFIVNYEILRTLWSAIAEKGLQMLILDESTRVKGHNAQVTTATHSLAQGVPYRLLLSGQPIANTPLDLYSQFLILDDGETFGTNFYRYRNYYFKQIRMGRFSKWDFKKNKYHEVTSKMYEKGIRYLLEECITLPGKTYQVHEIEMTKDQRILYDTVKEQVLTEIGEICKINEEGRATIKADIAITKLMKLAQVCSGFSYTKGKTVTLKKNPKIEVLEELVMEIVPTRKILIWCKYKATMRMVEAMLKKKGIGNVTYSGDQNPIEKKKREDIFQNDNNIRALVGQIRSGIGQTFTAANYAIYVENEWSPEPRDQSEKRIYRITQERKVVIIDLVMKNSVEESVLKALRGKQKVASLIMKDPISDFIEGSKT